MSNLRRCGSLSGRKCPYGLSQLLIDPNGTTSSSILADTYSCQIALPRLSYLPLLLPRLHAFFSNSLIADSEIVSPYSGQFTYDNVPLKWHLPLGLLYDVYVASTRDNRQDPVPPAPLPFKLTLNFSPEREKPMLLEASPLVLHDSFINSIKEADFLRSGTAKPIMTLSAQESQALWTSTQEGDLQTFSKIHGSLIPSPGQMRHVPLRLYLPTAPDQDPSKAQIKVLQSHISPIVAAVNQGSTPAALRGSAAGQPQSLGTALHQLIPSLFPSRRTPILATPLLHGAAVPMSTHLEELVRWGCYADGWVSVVIAMRG